MCQIPASEQEVKDEIKNVFLQRINGVPNCASIRIERKELPFEPRYDMRKFVDDSLKEVADKKGFLYSEDFSDDAQLFFVIK